MRSTAIYRGRMILILLLLPALIGWSGCGSRTKKGAGIGAAAGAVTGAVIGHQSGHKTEGAVIGAAVGGVLGGAVGARLDKQAEELAQIAETRRTEQGLIVTLASNKIHFDVNSSVVQSPSRDVLVELAGILKKYPEDLILVAGHTDSDGSANYNLKLSEMRAQAVGDILVTSGVPGETVTIRGYGETQPIASNDSVQGKALNRRVELTITVDETKVPEG
ncbi:MAG: OmpA family protein [Candidatus Eisenbacteria bacterium]|nr:OmpA family protein [Candidatus Eisenbacteria bacterium]